jgi:4-amino-4-deoxy-L-arabinose transferase-like glycosyltransferase
VHELWTRLRRWLPLLGLAVAARVVYWVLVTPRWVPVADADQYVRLGRSLAEGHGFRLVYPQFRMHPTAFRPPLYPMTITPGLWLFPHSLWPVRLLNLLTGSGVVVLLAVLTARLGGRRAGLAAGVVAALYPPLLGSDTVSLTDPLALLLLLAAVLLADDEHWAWAGVALGALLLTRPNGYLVVAIVALWAWRRADFRKAALVLGCTFLVFFPWLVRNRIQVHTWRPTTSDGLTLVAVYGEKSQAVGTFVDPVFSPVYGDLKHRLERFDEAGWNTALTKEAIDGVKAHPRYVLHVVRQNTEGYFEIRPSTNEFAEVSDGRSWRFRQDTLVAFYVVTLTGLAGIAMLARDRRGARVDLILATGAIVAQFVVISILLVAPPRLRAPFDVAMCAGAGLLYARVADRRASG